MSAVDITDSSILDHVFKVEGWPRYTNDPTDRGGPTKGGITLATLSAYRGRPCTADDVRSLPESEAADIYTTRYIAPFARVADGLLRFQLVDCGVLHGVGTAVRWLQGLVNVAQDGGLGPITAAAVDTYNPHVLGLRLAAYRIRFIGRLIERDRSQAKYAGGWTARATGFIELETDRCSTDHLQE